MKLQKIYTALLTADLAAAEGWYTKLLGRGPDYRPMDTLVQWELFDQGGLALSSDDEIAGRGVMFLYVDDVAAERRRLQGLGIVLGDDIGPTLNGLRPSPTNSWLSRVTVPWCTRNTPSLPTNGSTLPLNTCATTCFAGSGVVA